MPARARDKFSRTPMVRAAKPRCLHGRLENRREMDSIKHNGTQYGNSAKYGIIMDTLYLRAAISVGGVHLPTVF